MKRFLLVFLICYAQICKAQSNDSLKFSINIMPQYLIINGIRGDIEYQVNSSVSVYGGLQYYSGNINKDGFETVQFDKSNNTSDQSKRLNDELNGSGFNLGCKYYFTDNGSEKFYVGAEYVNNGFDLKINDYNYFPYLDNGLTFYEYKMGQVDYTIRQSAYNFTAGVTTNKKRLLLNAWFGFSYTDADFDKRLSDYRKFNSYVGNYAFKGWSPILGFKIGLLLF